MAHRFLILAFLFCYSAFAALTAEVGAVVEADGHSYTLTGKLGSGAFGDVFRARREDGAELAIKITDPFFHHQLNASQRVSAKIKDPAVIEISMVGPATLHNGPGQSAQILISVMEVVEGIVLEDFINGVREDERFGRSTGEQIGATHYFEPLTILQRERFVAFANNTMQKVFHFLEAMAAADLVHNDIRAANLMLVTGLSIPQLATAIRDGQVDSLPVKVIDYGSVRGRGEKRIEGRMFRSYQCDGICKPEKDILDLAAIGAFWVQRMVPLRPGETYLSTWTQSSARRFLSERPRFSNFERLVSLSHPSPSASFESLAEDCRRLLLKLKPLTPVDLYSKGRVGIFEGIVIVHLLSTAILNAACGVDLKV